MLTPSARRKPRGVDGRSGPIHSAKLNRLSRDEAFTAEAHGAVLAAGD
jgi:hypothetical protein